MEKPKFELKKIARGEYQVIRPDGSNYFAYPVSKNEATQTIQDEQVHAMFLVDVRINKAVQRFIMDRDIKDSLDTFIYQYSYQLGHREMRRMIKRPALFIEYIEERMAKDKAARKASVQPEPTVTIAEQIATLQSDVTWLKQQVEYLNNRVNN